ncbi:MAG: UPF0182 family protein [Candidatus Hadarchaeaceae archaeon]
MEGSFGRILYALTILILALFAALIVLPGILMDYWWFESIGYSQIFTTNISWRLILFVIGWTATSLSLFLTFREMKKYLKGKLSPIVAFVARAFSAVIGLLVGLSLSDS